MTFHVGQKVVCIDDSDQEASRERVIKGEVYTVAGHFGVPDGRCGIYLSKMRRRSLLWGDGWGERRFRPLAERKTDISIFKRMLKPSKIDAVSGC